MSTFRHVGRMRPQYGMSDLKANGRKVLIGRSGTCYGISAAVGKAGAAIGVQAFAPIQKHLGSK